MLTVNADDWGWTRQITDRIVACYQGGRVHRTSGMIFMADSERGASIATEVGLKVGLHLNLTEPFGGLNASIVLRERHERIARYLLARRANQVVWNPFLRLDVEYVVRAQWEEYERLYGHPPMRLDGHLHMHLCMNMLLSGLIRRGLEVRRHFTFAPGEKGLLNRLYRQAVDRWLATRCQIADFFFSMAPVLQDRLEKIISLSSKGDVELMVHPGVENEYRFLLSEQWSALTSKETT